ncbi:MAG TPA: hypothetical protein PKY42_10615, partial [Mesotoga sp.]|nr:hypothetical protein [Mesotoga sp.]
MRRFVLFILFAFSLFFVITGCVVSNPKVERLVPPENAPEEVIFAPLSDSGVQSSSLIVGADTVIGRIEYWVDDEEKLLYIDFYATENGWLLTETRVATALSLAELPRNPETRRLDPDYYPNFNIHNPPVGISHFVLPLGELEPGTTTKLYFSAYAEAIRKENKYFSQIGITAPCVYYVITYTEPVIELRPILNVEVDGKIALSRVTEYDWQLTKEATPEAIVDLERGDSATVEYTLTATRSVPEIKDTYTASGVATVTNYGSLEATKVGLKVTLLGKKGTDWLEIDSKVLIEISSNTTIAASDLVGIGKPFTFTFDAGDYTEVKILAQAEDDWPESVSDEENHMVPVSPTGETKIDESASVIDMPVNLADFESRGFLVDHTGTWPWDESPWILDDVSGGQKIYSISIKNESADENSFGVTLTNIATLTESDTLEIREDNARVLVTTPEPFIETPDLDMTLEATVSWTGVLEYDWTIEKSATPTSLTLAQGNSGTVNYSVAVTRVSGDATYTYTISGTATVLNTGNIALNVAGAVNLDGYAGKTVSIGPLIIAAGASHEVPFTFTVESATEIINFTVKGNAHSVDLPVNVDKSLGLVSPGTPESYTEIDEMADVIDKITGLPSGFKATASVEPREWKDLTDDATFTYIVTVTNEEATSGGKLTNTATVTENDTDEEDSDDEEVTVNVPGLNMVLEATVNWSKEIEYDWSIAKDATPTSLTLVQGSSGTVDYTVVVTKESKDATYTYTVSGKVIVQNTGTVGLTGVNGTVYLDGHAGKSLTLGPVSLATGESKEFPYSFTVESDTEITGFTVKAEIDSAETSDVSDSKNLTPSVDPQSLIEIDEMADVIDEITGQPSGFDISVSVEPRVWNGLTDSATFTYTVTVTNQEATSGGKLTNTATVTENDTNEEDSDDEEVVLNVLGLNMELEAAVNWSKEIEYDWSIVKDATPTSLTLTQGSSGTVAYTVVVTRESEDATYTYNISGKVIVQNTGTVGLTNVEGTVYLDGYAGKSLALGPVSLAAAESKEFPYSFTVESKSKISGFTVKAEIDSAETSGIDDSENLTPSVDPQSLIEIDEMADVIDEITGQPSGFDISASVEPRVWNGLTDSATFTYTLTVTNQEATSGGKITNTATVTENDTKEEDSDDEEVTISVPGLNMTLEATVSWAKEQEYDWEIEKEATPTSLSLAEGNSGNINYTLEITRESGQATYTYTISGTATVQNTGDVPLTDVYTKVTLVGYSMENTVLLLSPLAPGGSEDTNFSFTIRSNTEISG